MDAGHVTVMARRARLLTRVQTYLQHYTNVGRVLQLSRDGRVNVVRELLESATALPST